MAVKNLTRRKKSTAERQLPGHGSYKGRRIGSLKSHLSRAVDLVGEDGFRGATVDRKRLEESIKSSAGKLTWFDAAHASPAAIIKRADGSALATITGTPLKEITAADYKMADAKSILDFDATVTTARRDRDGDVLVPEGAIIDPKMPLLWQHVPFEPIGRMVAVLVQDDKRVCCRFTILDTILGRDAATLVEGGALRISHGFQPIEYEPLKDADGREMDGWKMLRYLMMEASTVSIPSNIDAEIETWSRGKFHHPFVKSYYRTLFKSRPKVMAKYTRTLKAKAKRNDDLEGVASIIKALGEAFGPSAARTTKKGKKAEDDAETETEDTDKDDDELDDDDADGATSKTPALAELIAMASAASSDGDMPGEAVNRLATVVGLLTEADASVDKYMEDAVVAAQGRDIAGLFAAAAEMVAGCMGKIQSAADEAGRVAEMQDLPESAASSLAELRDACSAMCNAIAAISGKDGAADDSTVQNDSAGVNGMDGQEQPAKSFDFIKAASRMIGLCAIKPKKVDPATGRALVKAIRSAIARTTKAKRLRLAV